MLALHDEIRRLGARLTNIPLISREVTQRIPSAISERAPAGTSFHKLRKWQELATARWKQLEGLAETVDPQFEPSEIDSARQFFRQNARNLNHLVTGRDKNPIPEDSDIEIMIQLSKLQPRPVFVVSRDAHFVGYSDLLGPAYGLEVVEALRLPLILQEWRQR